MNYEVTYITDGEQHSDQVDVNSAAEAVEKIQNELPSTVSSFELIQVEFLDEMPEEITKHPES